MFINVTNATYRKYAGYRMNIYQCYYGNIQEYSWLQKECMSINVYHCYYGNKLKCAGYIMNAYQCSMIMDLMYDVYQCCYGNMTQVTVRIFIIL